MPTRRKCAPNWTSAKRRRSLASYTDRTGRWGPPRRLPESLERIKVGGSRFVHWSPTELTRPDAAYPDAMESEVRDLRLRTGITVPYLVQVEAGAKPVLLLHARGESRGSFDRLVPLLTAFRINAPDLRRQGAADKPEAGYSLAEQSARRVADYADPRHRLGRWSGRWATPGAAGLQEPTAMSFAVGTSLCPHARSTALEENIMAATYTFDVFTSLDGFGAHSGNWGGYWGKQGPELLDHRLALYDQEQRMVFGANTYRAHAQMLASSTEESEVRDPWVTRMRNLPATVVSSTLEGPLDWPDATVVSGDAVGIVARLKEVSEVPLRSHGSLSLNRALMAAGLVDRVQVTLFPVITGQTGVAPIFQGGADFDLELIESRTLDGHTQELIYRPTLHH